MQSRFLHRLEVHSKLIDTPIHTIQGFIVNKYCDHIKMLFLRDDQSIIFKNNNLWLFIDNDASLEIDVSIVSIAKY